MQHIFSFPMTIEDEIKSFAYKIVKVSLLVFWALYAVNMLVS